MKWHIPIPFFYSNKRGGQGGHAWALVPLSYASDSSVARICQRGAKAREHACKATEALHKGLHKALSQGGQEIVPLVPGPPTVGRFFFINMYQNGNFLHIEFHY